MKYCPFCGTEYLDHVKTCADDDEPLVDEETWASLQKEPLSGPLRVLRQLEGPFHAHVVEDVLIKEDIPHTIRSFDTTAFSKIFIPRRGWGIALVLDQDLERADEAVRRVMEARFEAVENGDHKPDEGE